MKKFGVILWRLLLGATKEFINDECPTAAAALAYYALFAFAPLLALVLGISSMLIDPGDVQRWVNRQLPAGSTAQEQVESMVAPSESEATGWIAALMSVGILLVGATGLFAQLQAAINQAWGVKAEDRATGFKDLAWKRLLSAGLILVIALLLLSSVLASTSLAVISNHFSSYIGEAGASFGLKVANGALSLGVFTLLFGLTFKLLPDANVRWKDVWFGAAVTAVLFTLGKALLAVYFGYAKIGSTFGAAGGVVLLLAFIYYSAMIFLWGAEFTQVWARMRGHNIVAGAGAVLSQSKPADQDPIE